MTNTIHNVPRELLADLLGNDHDKRIMAERHLLAMLANAPSPAGVDGLEVVGWYTEDHLDDKSATTYSRTVAERWVEKGWPVSPLYAAPVSEAKAQGVVQWPEADEIMQMAFEEGQPADDASGYCFELEEFDLFIDRLMSEVARLNAAPAAPAADAGLVEALDYQALFDAIAAATSVYANGAINISVQAFRDALAAHRAKGVV